MGILDHLWDDTIARIGKLRKTATPTFRSNSSNESEQAMNDRREEAAAEDGVRVSRSIMIVKAQQQGSEKDSPPVSPAGFTPPASPFAGCAKVEEGRRRRSVSGGDDDDHHLRTRRVVMVEDTGALLLLTTCDM